MIQNHKDKLISLWRSWALTYMKMTWLQYLTNYKAGGTWITKIHIPSHEFSFYECFLPSIPLHIMRYRTDWFESDPLVTLRRERSVSELSRGRKRSKKIWGWIRHSERAGIHCTQKSPNPDCFSQQLRFSGRAAKLEKLSGVAETHQVSWFRN